MKGFEGPNINRRNFLRRGARLAGGAALVNAGVLGETQEAFGQTAKKREELEALLLPKIRELKEGAKGGVVFGRNRIDRLLEKRAIGSPELLAFVQDRDYLQRDSIEEAIGIMLSYFEAKVREQEMTSIPKHAQDDAILRLRWRLKEWFERELNEIRSRENQIFQELYKEKLDTNPDLASALKEREAVIRNIESLGSELFPDR